MRTNGVEELGMCAVPVCVLEGRACNAFGCAAHHVGWLASTVVKSRSARQISVPSRLLRCACWIGHVRILALFYNEEYRIDRECDTIFDSDFL